MSIEENKAIIRRFLEALDQQNFDALKSILDCINGSATERRRISN